MPPVRRPVWMVDRTQHPRGHVRVTCERAIRVDAVGDELAVDMRGDHLRYRPAGCHVHEIAQPSASVAVRRSQRIGVPRPMAS